MEDDCKKQMESWLKPDGAISDLKKAQVEEIARGQHQNLIITGGPGTGKTTVVFFLLWNLLKKDTKYYLAMDPYRELKCGTLVLPNRQRKDLCQ